jgi:hypothetical protein
MHLPSLLATEPKATRFSSDAWMAKEQAIPEEGERKGLHGKQGYFQRSSSSSSRIGFCSFIVGKYFEQWQNSTYCR